MSELLHVEVSGLAAKQMRVAEAWWRANRPKAPNAIREELERASALVASQPEIGSRARHVKLAGVRRIHLARSGFEQAFREMHALGDGLDPVSMTAIAARYGVEVDFERTAPIIERHGLAF